MSWRTQGQYRGLGDTESAWLREFDRRWERKAEGRSQADAMEYIVHTDGVEKCSSTQDDADPYWLDAQLMSIAPQILRIAVPRPSKRGWFIPMVLVCRRKTRANFRSYEDAAQAYLAIGEFMHWFRPVIKPDSRKQQEGGSHPHLSGPPLSARPAETPREKGSPHLVLVPPQNPPCHSIEPPSPLARSRPT